MNKVKREITFLRMHLIKFWDRYNGEIPLQQALLSTKIIKARINELEQKLKYEADRQV